MMRETSPLSGVYVPVTVEDRERYARIAAAAEADGFKNPADQFLATLGAEALTAATAGPGDHTGLKEWAMQFTQRNGEQ